MSKVIHIECLADILTCSTYGFTRATLDTLASSAVRWVGLCPSLLMWPANAYLRTCVCVCVCVCACVRACVQFKIIVCSAEPLLMATPERKAIAIAI